MRRGEWETRRRGDNDIESSSDRQKMETREYDFEVEGEVIKMIHDELPAVRWTCGGCGEDSCTIFYEADLEERTVECESCRSLNLVHRASRA